MTNTKYLVKEKQGMDLRDYQKQGVDRLFNILGRDGAGLLADEMGLGKTLQAMRVAEKLRVGRVFVICPASLQANWSYEVFRNGSHDINWFIYSYEHAVKRHDLMKDIDMLILDEAHYCKNRSAKRTKVCFNELWKKAEFKLLMTGTPCPNGLMDGWSLFNKLDKEAFPNKYKYGWRYCNVKKNWFTNNWDFYGAKKETMPELREKLSEFMVRRRKKEVLQELPDKIYSLHYTPIPQAKDYRLSDSETQDAFAAVQSDSVATKRRGVGELKADKIKDLVSNVLLEKNRLVLFTYHQSVSDKVMQVLESVDCKPLQITGKTSLKKRDEHVQLFQSDCKEPLVLVAQIEAAGIGINLTAADTCIFLELDWVPARMAQAIDRLHRIGQRSVVQVLYVVGTNTLDEQIIGSLREKIEAISGAIK